MEKIIVKTLQTNGHYSVMKVTHAILISLFRIALLLIIVDAILKGDNDLVLLASLTSLTSFYREYIRLFTGMRLTPGMQIITTIFIICGALLGTLLGVYFILPWWDTLLHALSGVLLTFFGVMILAVMKNRNKNLRYSLFLIIFFAFVFSVTCGTIWEIMEFSADTFLGFDAQRSKGVDYGVQDTMHDTVANTVGALVTSLGLYFYFKKKEEKEIYEKLDSWFIVKD